jgi:hypothetical protein
MGSGGKINQKGRNKNESYIGLQRRIYNSLAYKELPPPARCIYMELRARYNTYNNGYISLSVREAAQVIHGSTATASRVFKQLQAHGLIKMNNKGVYQNRHATTWILTSEPFNNQLPTNEWRDYVP